MRADERYPPGPSGQAPTGGTAAAGANPAENAGKSGLLPLSDSSQPATSGAVGNAASDIFPAAAGAPAASGAPASSGAGSNTFQPSSAGPRPPRSFEPLDSRGASSLSGQSGSVPAQFQERPNVYGSGAPASQPDAIMKPSAMMRAMLVAPNGSQLSGQPVKLVDLMANARSRAEQSQRIEAYWDLCSSVADYYLGLRELQEVQGYARLNGQFWDQVYKDMSIRNATSLRARARRRCESRV